VKTLQDRPFLMPGRKTTIHYLITRQPPAHLPDTRLPLEHRVFTLIGSGNPRPSRGRQRFARRAPPGRQSHDQRSAGAVLHQPRDAATASSDGRSPELRPACARARVTGVAFFDFDHGQTGVAPNAIELHPILGFRCLS
jgi:hypothetical protein